MQTLERFLLIALLMGLIGCGRPESPAPPPAAEGSGQPSPTERSAAASYVVDASLPFGAIRGRVFFAGKPPGPEFVRVSQDPEVCGRQLRLQRVEVGKGGLHGALVWLEGINRGKPFDFAEPVLDQQRCRFVPHIVVMSPGELKVKSSDPIPHNLHTFAEVNRNYNEVVNPLHSTLSFRFARPERIEIRCDLHKWMRAYVVVAADPYYAISGPAGQFELRNVPTGRYTLRVWHEVLGEQQQEVIVEANKTSDVSFKFPSGQGSLSTGGAR